MSALIGAFLSVNVENVAKASGSDGFVWTFLEKLDLLSERLFDPTVAWVFWLTFGMFIGGLLFNWGHDLEEKIRG